jgi:NADH-quinone oxidoreductase subunit L
VWLPLVLLAIPSIIVGALTVKPLLFGGGFGKSIFLNAEHHEALQEIGHEFGNWWTSRSPHLLTGAVPGGRGSLRRLGAVLEVAAPAGSHRREAQAAALGARKQVRIRRLQRKGAGQGGRLLGSFFWKAGDQVLIDGAVNGSANTIGFIAGVVRRVQSGFLYSYAFWMVIGLAVMLGWFLTHT